MARLVMLMIPPGWRHIRYPFHSGVVTIVMDCGNQSPHGDEPTGYTTKRFVGVRIQIRESDEIAQFFLVRAGHLDGMAAFQCQEILAVDMRLHFLDLVHVDDG